MSLTAASVIMEEINRTGGNSGTCQDQMYNMNTLIRHGSEEQRRTYLPKIASGELRLQSIGITKPTAGTDTNRIKTTAVRKGDRYVINGQKVMDQTGETFGPDDPAGTHHTAGSGFKEVRRPVHRPCRYP